MLTDWNFWLSVVTASVAVAALIQSHQQIKLSNKQHLFDKRVENYLVVMGMVQLYRNNHLLFEENKKDEPLLAIDFDFTLLTNNSYLEPINPVITNSLKEPYHKEFLIKLENLKDIAAKIKFLFTGRASVLLGDFVLRYQELLFAMYQYKIRLVKMEETSQKFNLTLQESQLKVGENKQRVKLQAAFDNLEQTYLLLEKENVEDYIKKQIKL